MSYLGRFMYSARLGVTAFRASMLASDPQRVLRNVVRPNEWGSFAARRNRYSVNWDTFENTVYSNAANLQAEALKAAYGLDESIRALYNPAARLGDFYCSRLMGGRLDPAAGDGDSESSAIPILTNFPDIRPALSLLWRDSVWAINKDIYTRWGAVLGDVALAVVDDPDVGQVRLEVVHPGEIEWAQFDAVGNVKAYDRVRLMDDPRIEGQPIAGRKPIEYREVVRRDGESVIFTTLLDGEPYPFNGESARWEVPYGFVPLVIAHHEPLGGSHWAACCFHNGRPKFFEVDHLASKMGDHMARASESPMLLKGVKDPKEELKTGRQRAAQEETGWGREEGRRGDLDARANRRRDKLQFLYGDADASAQHLTFEMDYEGTVQHIRGLLDSIEKDYPELTADTGAIAGTITATAIAMARDRATDKVQARRVGYEDALVRAQMMALAIGGFRKYPGYEAFDLASYKAGKLAHGIGPRPVFGTDPADEIKQKSAEWALIQQQVALGIPLEYALELNGWKKADLKKLADARAKVAPATTIPATA